MQAHGELGWAVRLIRLTVDGPIYGDARLSTLQEARSVARAVVTQPGDHGEARGETMPGI